MQQGWQHVFLRCVCWVLCSAVWLRVALPPTRCVSSISSSHVLRPPPRTDTRPRGRSAREEHTAAGTGAAHTLHTDTNKQIQTNRQTSSNTHTETVTRSLSTLCTDASPTVHTAARSITPIFRCMVAAQNETNVSININTNKSVSNTNTVKKSLVSKSGATEDSRLAVAEALVQSMSEQACVVEGGLAYPTTLVPALASNYTPAHYTTLLHTLHTHYAHSTTDNTNTTNTTNNTNITSTTLNNTSYQEEVEDVIREQYNDPALVIFSSLVGNPPSIDACLEAEETQSLAPSLSSFPNNTSSSSSSSSSSNNIAEWVTAQLCGLLLLAQELRVSLSLAAGDANSAAQTQNRVSQQSKHSHPHSALNKDA